MLSSVLTIRDPGQKLSEAYQTKLLDKYSTAFGYAVPLGENIDVEMFSSVDVNLAEQMKEVEKVYADNQVFYWHLHMDDGDDFNIESFQPFVLAADDKKNLLVAIIEGECIKHNPTEESPFSNEFRLFDSFLRPKVEELIGFAEGELPKLMSLLDKDSFRSTLKEHLAPRGNLLLLPAKGDPLSYADNSKEHGKFNWGFTTNAMGLKEEDTAPAAGSTGVPATKQPLSLKKPATAKPVASVVSVTSKEKEEADPKKVFAKALGDGKKRFYINGKGELYCKPEAGLNDFKSVRRMWVENCQDPLPKTDGSEKDAQAIHRGWPIARMKAGSTYDVAYKKLMGIPVGEKEEPKKADSVQGPGKPEEPKREEMGFTLLIPADKRIEFVNKWKEGAYKATDLPTLLKMTKEHPKATEQLGITLDEFRMLDPSSLRRIVNDRGAHLVVCLIHELRMASLGAHAEPIKEGEEKPGEQAEPPKPKAKTKLSLKAA